MLALYPKMHLIRLLFAVFPCHQFLIFVDFQNMSFLKDFSFRACWWKTFVLRLYIPQSLAFQFRNNFMENLGLETCPVVNLGKIQIPSKFYVFDRKCILNFRNQQLLLQVRQLSFSKMLNFPCFWSLQCWTRQHLCTDFQILFSWIRHKIQTWAMCKVEICVWTIWISPWVQSLQL